MPELRFIIADGLPERELDYLKQNIRPEPDLKLVVTGKNNANRRAEFSLFPPEESVLISTDGHIISNMDHLGSHIGVESEQGAGSRFRFTHLYNIKDEIL